MTAFHFKTNLIHARNEQKSILKQNCMKEMDNLYYRRTFDLDNKNEIPGKNLLKVVKFKNLVEKYCNMWKI